ncbi:hypothetical protein RU93_GL001167 [Enterococcus aquimarinus]|uniref:Uncharacterized protein n=1 Tax=Enterococcus aquimarinus TaxID=328396 RepID=A0A1L8QWU9_9ENTE|nr:hypothetical protein RU93_GL001167 [Enterococcus aquimarinus]
MSQPLFLCVFLLFIFCMFDFFFFSKYLPRLIKILILK